MSINYRLGPLGFLGLDSAGIYGNQGIGDVLVGLEWVQKNVAAFGGNKVCSHYVKRICIYTKLIVKNSMFECRKKVVLFGQSAGATDVFTIASLPQAPKLMNAVIAESIPDTPLLFNSTLQSTGASYATALNCSVSDVSTAPFIYGLKY